MNRGGEVEEEMGARRVGRGNGCEKSRVVCATFGKGGGGGESPWGVVGERVKLTDLLLVWQAELTSWIIINVFIILSSN